MTCPCDDRRFPPRLVIGPGLTHIPRQVAGFPEIRLALLSGISEERHAIPFVHWTAREGTDLGLMLLEMWAYLADILSFYDEIHAHEAYLRTARRRESVRKLVDLLGYLPTPAVAAVVELALAGEGKLPVTVPARTGFRSGEVAGGPPQVFEIEQDRVIHALRNRWEIGAPVPQTLGDAGIEQGSELVFLLDPVRSERFVVGELIVIEIDGSVNGAGSVTAVQEVNDAEGRAYRQVSVGGVALPFGADGDALSSIRLYKPTRTSGLNTVDVVTSQESANSRILEGVISTIRPGDRVLLQVADDLGWFEVDSASTVLVTRDVSTEDTVALEGFFPFTKLEFDADLDDADQGSASFPLAANRTKLTVHHGLIVAGTPIAMPSEELGGAGALALAGRIRPPREDPGGSRFAATDDDGQAHLFDGSVDFVAASVTPDTGFELPTMVLPVQVHGNLVTATHGESVLGEVLGSGDGGRASQSFSLKKAPLTYVSNPTTDSGLASSLTVYVDGVRWTEVGSFFGVQPSDTVYVVRLDEAGTATVTFGDGVRGARLPTGAGNVMADYRFGAGEAAPEAQSIAQIATPTGGLSSVLQPVAASGGADAQSQESIRTHAPAQALFLGRAVSIGDYQTVAASYPGVRAATAGWAWEGTRQTTLVRLWFIGDTSLQAPLLARLQGVSDPTTLFEVGAATAVPVTLELTVDIDPNLVASEVEAQIATALGDPATGLLAPERIGIGTRFRFSALRAMVHSVTGVVSVRSTWWSASGVVVTTSSVSPGQGAYFDLVDAGALTINGRVHALA